jgi:hypothetical protein
VETRAPFCASLPIALAAVACGGRTGIADVGNPGVAAQDAAPPDAGPPPATCGHPTTFSMTASSLVVSVADVPLVVTPRGVLVFGVSSVAAAPTGDPFFFTWATFTTDSGLPLGHAAVAHVGSHTLTATAPFSVTPFAQAVFDGTDFAVTGIAPDDGTPVTGGPAHLVVQRFGVDGRETSKPVSVAPVPYGWVSSAVSMPRGVAVGWGDAAGAALIAEDGSLAESTAFPPSVDPDTGLRVATPVGLTVVQGQLIASHGDTLTTLGWLGEAPKDVRTPFIQGRTLAGGPRGGACFFANGDALTMWGATPGADASEVTGVYAGPAAGPFARIGAVDETSTFTQEPDGCGGLITLSKQGDVLGVSAGTPSRTAPLGTLLEGPQSAATMTTTASGFAVAWIDVDGIHLATFDWQ